MNEFYHNGAIMNKNYTFLIMIVAFFALEAGAEGYDYIVSAYNNGTLNQLNKQTAITTVQNHKQQLEAQSGGIVTVIGSVLTKLTGAGVFLASLISAGASAAMGYIAHNI